MTEFDVRLNDMKIEEIVPYNPVVVECGANVGNTTKCFLRRFFNLQLFCFEPDPRCIEIFKRSISDSRCKLYEAAISDVDGFTELHLSSGYRPNQEGINHINASTIKGVSRHKELHPWIEYEKSIQVKTIKLDTWRLEEDINTIDFMWIDVEGAIENLIKGGFETLERTRYLYTEYADYQEYNDEINLADILKLLPSFEIVRQWPNDVFLRNKGEEG